MIKCLRVGCDLDDTIFGFSEGYIKRFKKWPKYDWAVTRNVEHILSKERDFWVNLPVRVDVFIEDSPHQWKSLNMSGIPCLLINGDNNKEYGPVLKIYSLDYEEIEDAYYMALELGIFEEFDKYFG